MGIAVLADAESRQPVMLQPQDGVGGIAEQDLHQMLGAEALSRARHRRHRLLRLHRGIEARHVVLAEVAMAAGAALLAEIGQQRLPPAARTFAERDQCVEALALDALAVFARLALLDLQADRKSTRLNSSH